MGVLDTVLDAVAGRVEPPCPFVAEGLWRLRLATRRSVLQSEMRQEIVADALHRLDG